MELRSYWHLEETLAGARDEDHRYDLIVHAMRRYDYAPKDYWRLCARIAKNPERFGGPRMRAAALLGMCSKKVIEAVKGSFRVTDAMVREALGAKPRVPGTNIHFAWTLFEQNYVGSSCTPQTPSRPSSTACPP